MLLRGWTFDPWEVHSYLVGRTVDLELDRLNVLSLIGEARSAVASQGQAATEYLRMMRYDDEWWDDEIDLGTLFILCIAPHLSPAPGTDSILYLADRLKNLGWSSEDCALLENGDPMSTMLDLFPVDPLTRVVRFDLRDWRYGGWLSYERASDLHARLLNEERRIRDVNDDFASRYAESIDAAILRDTIDRALDALIRLLRSLADTPQRAIRLIVD